VDLSVSLLGVLMPLLVRLRHLFDLDAEPAVIDRHLADAGLSALVEQRPGLRLAGGFDGFEVAVRALLGSDGVTEDSGRRLGRLLEVFAEPYPTGLPGLGLLGLTAERLAEAGPHGLVRSGLPQEMAAVMGALARAMSDRLVRLEPGADVTATLEALRGIGVAERISAAIVARALHWPDTLPVTETVLHASGAADAAELQQLAERWRPWRAYAAAHLQAASPPNG
jgi:AraC family transcriptional regulator of adaptative response / DNA-3-methyladenine glycosylase II